MRKILPLLALIVALVAACSSPANETSSSDPSALGGRGRPAGVPASYVATPNGYFDPSCVVRVAASETVRADGTIRGATADAVRPSAPCTRPRFDLAGNAMPIGRAGAALAAPQAVQPAASAFNGWVESYSTTSVGAVSFLSSSWVVPQTPTAGDRGQTVYFFNGLEGVPTVESILQPVIAYSGGQWTAASWNCCAQGTTFTGNTIPIHPGDVIVGTVTGTSCHASSGLCDQWVIETLDQTTGASSVLQTESWGVALNWVFPAVLEVYGVSACNQLPASGKLAFYDQSFTTVSGTTGTTAAWSLGLGNVQPACSYGGQIDGASVTLDFTGAGSSSGPPSGGGGFASSCTGIKLAGSTLSASCRDRSGRARSTSLDLNGCVTNDDGVERFQGAGYSASCTGCTLGGTTLSCQCADVSGAEQSTSLDLNGGLSNCNGVLTCGGC
jgi:hypothetical protein